MRIFNKFRGTKGFLSVARYMLRFRDMITETAQQRIRILTFWKKHGFEATYEAFRTSERTLYRWQNAIVQGGGKLESLNLCSTAPTRRRTRTLPTNLEHAIITLRTEHPRLGKNKIHPLLVAQGFVVSSSTVGRVLGDLKVQRRIPLQTTFSFYGATGILTERIPKKRRKKLRRPKGYRVLQVDTIVRFVDGVKRYLLTGIDTEKRTAFAACYTNHGSRSAADFLRCAREVLPDCPSAIQTDNGSEFALHFDHVVEELDLTHFHTYPRSPKMNAHVERFNRTLDEEFLRYHRALMRDDVSAFNNALIDWLLWYNGERPHYALGQVSPFKAMMKSLSTQECQMWWTHTSR